MENLTLPATSATPAVQFDAATGMLALSGESYPENAFEFYKPLLAWVAAYLKDRQGQTTAEIALSYLNTSSIKSVMDLLDLLEASHRQGRQVSVRWSYHKENDRALEMIEEFKEEVTLPFFIVPVGA
ncbi:MAG: biofilm regulation phosphoprotein SiaC [Proteobacteria bacterium]|nr:biofilm regulation phosphoprotein SiaC [Pseudomonadota bacterium]